MKLEITQNEAQVLAELLNVAVKAGGLQVAKSAVYFVDKIDQALRNEKSVEGESNDDSENTEQ